jgi:uncharacterized protein YndB with AHSA1/START domain
MADIKHQTTINAPASKIYELITTIRGIHKWLPVSEGWKITGQENVGGTLTFFYGPYFHEMKILKLDLDKEVKWLCPIGHPEWVGTTVDFSIEDNGDERLLNFSHAGWAAKTEWFEQCNQIWGSYVNTIKKLAEKK